MIRVEQYSPAAAKAWDDFVRKSKNGTFLFCRGFMDYHADRFTDASLLFYDDKGLCGLLPASVRDTVVTSHGGLTYGGYVLGDNAVQRTVDEMVRATVAYYRKQGMTRLVIKPVPYIYIRIPAEEELYSLTRLGAVLRYRCVSSALHPTAHPKQRQSRRGGVVRARKSGLRVLRVDDPDSAELRDFYAVLADVLLKRHHVKPVHSYDEMRLLMSRFPDEIKLFVTVSGCRVLAGVWMFVTGEVAHTQYIAVSDDGKRLGAGDLLIDQLISQEYSDKPWFDFGISTEDNGRILNDGLIFEKEGFGARSVCYDTYELDLPEAMKLLEA